MKKNSCSLIATIAMVCLAVFISGCSNKQAAFKKRIETELAVPVAELVETLQSPKGKELTERITKTGAAMSELEKECAALKKDNAGPPDKFAPLVNRYAELLKDSFIDARELYALEEAGIEGMKDVLAPMERESTTALEANKDVIEATMKPFADINIPLMVILQRTETAFILAGNKELDKLEKEELMKIAAQVLPHFSEKAE